MIESLPREFRWVFLGDSATDAGRLDALNTHKSLGRGYVLLTGDLLNNLSTHFTCTPINRGVAKDCLIDLSKRLAKDVINENPHLVSILAGINDILGTLENGKELSCEQFSSTYRTVIHDVIKNTQAKILLIEPFLIAVESQKYASQITTLTQYQKAIRVIASEMQITHISLQSIFNNLCKKLPPSHWSHDGIYPSHAGHMTIALELIKALVIPGFSQKNYITEDKI